MGTRSVMGRIDAGLAAVHDRQRRWHPGVRLAWWVLALPLAIAAAAGASAGAGRKSFYFVLAGFTGMVFIAAGISPEPKPELGADGTTTTTTEATTTTAAPTTTTTLATTTVAPTTTTTAPVTTTTRRSAAVVTTTTKAPPTTAAPAPAGRCTASVDNPHPTTNQTITVLIESNVPSTSFTATAHYKSLDTVNGGTTGTSGAGAVAFMTSHATPGYTVRIDVSISGKATCSTSFTPQ